MKGTLLIKDNEFHYCKDGVNKKGTFRFYMDGTMKFSLARAPGNWKILDHKEKILWIGLNKKQFKYQFNENVSEAVMIDPVRDPPSKILRTTKSS